MADGETAAGSSPEKEEKGGENMDSEDEEEALYEVERVIAKSKIKGKTLYKVRWKGYGSEEDTWEPIENLESCLDIVEEYTNRQAEMARKRAEERKKKKVKQQESEDSSEDPDAPYPSTFKNSFWKDLEAGKINVFENDMYSKVKGRAAKPTNLKEPGSTASSSDNENSAGKKRHVSDPVKDSTKSSTKDTQKSKSAVKVKSKVSKDNSRSNKRNTSARKIEFKCMITSESESDSDMMDRRESFPHSVNTDTEKDKDIEHLANSLDQTPMLRTPEMITDIVSESTDSARTVNYSQIDTGSSDILNSDRVWENSRPSTPEGCKIMTDTQSSSSAKTINYSCLQNSDSEEKVLFPVLKEETSEDPLASHSSDRRVDELHTKSPSRKKKKKKHSKHRHHKHDKRKTSNGGDLGSSPLFKVVNQSTSEVQQRERKRKLSQSSDASNVTGDSVQSFKMPKLELEVCESDVTKIKIRNIHSEPRVESIPVNVGNESNRNSFNVNENIISRSHSCETLDSIKTSPSSVTSLCNQEKSASGNKTPQSLNNCSKSSSSSSLEPSAENKIVESHVKPNTVKSNNPSVSETNRDSNSSLCNSATKRLERSNSEVEQADSGIASPASEEGTEMSRKGFGNPLDDILCKTLMGGGSKLPGLGGDQELEIELDDTDWDLFDQEVKLEPINLNNSEFVAAVETGDYELVKRAFKGDGTYNLEAPDMMGKTLLMKAAEKAYDNIADLLIENGAKLDAQMHNGITPLMLACEHAEICTVNLLLEHGAKVNLQTAMGETALMMAAKRGHKQMLWLLLECGANFNMQSHAGYTAMSFIKHLHYTDSESILTSHIYRVMHEFDKQVAITLNNTANIIESLFPAQLFNICEGEQFDVKFDCSVTEPVAGVGNLLFIGHAVFANHEVKCRFYGPCAVKSVFLNGQKQSSLTEEANFVLAFSPLVNGRNVLTIDTVKAPGVKAKLIVCAYKAQLINS